MDQTITCPKCKNELLSEANFCQNCGSKIFSVLGYGNFHLTQIASLILLFQNIMISVPGIFVLGMIEDLIHFNSYYIISFLFYVDIVGFLLLGLGFFPKPPYVTQKQKMYLLSSCCILFWVVCRILWQFILTGNFLGDLVNFTQQPTSEMGFLDLISRPLNDIALPFLVGAIALGISSIIICRLKKGYNEKLFRNYAVINMIAVGSISAPIIMQSVVVKILSILPREATAAFVFLPYIGLIIKLLLLPLIGIIAFGGMFEKSTGKEFKIFKQRTH